MCCSPRGGKESDTWSLNKKAITRKQAGQAPLVLCTYCLLFILTVSPAKDALLDQTLGKLLWALSLSGFSRGP